MTIQIVRGRLRLSASPALVLPKDQENLGTAVCTVAGADELQHQRVEVSLLNKQVCNLKGHPKHIGIEMLTYLHEGAELGEEWIPFECCCSIPGRTCSWL